MLAPFRSQGLTPYLVGMVGVILASLLRFAFNPFLGEHLSFSFDYLAVFVAAWTGGFWPATATAIVSSLVSIVFFTDQYLSLKISSVEELIELIFFLTVSEIIAILCELTLRALDSAKRAEIEKDDFVATVAHELRSPLSVIYYANSMNRIAMEEGPAGEYPSEQLDVIDRQVNHLNLLINDLLDISRAARGKIQLRKRRVEMAPIIDGALEKSRPLIANHGHTLQLEVSRRPMSIFADPVRIEQMLTNLITNAAKYTPDGGQIGLFAEPVGESVVVSVHDNGVGILPEMLPRIFDMFVQGEGSRDRTEGGLGIGLSLARKICELHGGTIRAESAGRNRGSKFTITLPLAEPVAADVNLQRAAV